MRNTSWNCSPNQNSLDSNSMEANMTGDIGIMLEKCKNGGNCLAFELTGVDGTIQKGHKCECPEGFRYLYTFPNNLESKMSYKKIFRMKI